MSNYRRGSNRERQVVEIFRTRGWYAIRSAGSHGAADVVALKYGHTPIMVQVKANQRSAFAGFGPKDRKELREEARKAGAKALLLWWPPNGPRRYIWEEGWPD